MGKRGPKGGVNEPWYWKKRLCWYVTLGGTKHKLHPDKRTAWELWHSLVGEREAAPEKEAGVTDTLGGLLPAFEAHCRRTLSPRTSDIHTTWLALVRDHLGEGFPLPTLESYHIARWFATRPGWGVWYRRQCLSALGALCRWAREMGYLAKGFTLKVKLAEAPRRERVVSQSEYDALLAYFKGKAFEKLLRLAWETGMRPEEVVAARLEYFDPSLQALVFPRAKSKGRRRQRVVHLPPAALALVAAEVASRGVSGPLLVNQRGAPWNCFSVSCSFARYSKSQQRKQYAGYGRHQAARDAGHQVEEQVDRPTKEGLDEPSRDVRHGAQGNYRLYDLRHTFCQRCLLAGMSTVVVARLMGHASTAMVDRCYSHIEQDSTFLRSQLLKLS